MPEDVSEFIVLVRQMREAQRDYFKTRSGAALSKSKELERKVDVALRAVAESEKPNLFSGAE
ncbi:MAG TPA: hypothetical protein VGE74_22620 [Gemmata sp.]